MDLDLTLTLSRTGEADMKTMRPIRTIAMFPTMLTLGNLVCGFFAIVVASRVEAIKDVRAC